MKQIIRVPTEAQEHAAVVKYLAYKYPKARVQHSANEGKRSFTAQKEIKAQGVSKGYPDLVLYDWRSTRVLHLELKRIKGSKTSKEQKEWIEWLKGAGHEAVICKGYDEAVTAIDSFLK